MASLYRQRVSNESASQSVVCLLFTVAIGPDDFKLERLKHE